MHARLFGTLEYIVSRASSRGFEDKARRYFFLQIITTLLISNKLNRFGSHHIEKTDLI